MSNNPNSIPPTPPEAMHFLQKIGYLEPDRLKVGDKTPEIILQKLDQSGSVTLGISQSRPVALIFGSYT